MKKSLFSFLAAVSILLTTGCWDSTEIEQISFIMGLAFDTIENEEEKEQKTKKESGQEKRKHDDMFSVTFQVARPTLIQTKTGQGGGGDGDAFFNVTSTGITNFKIRRNLSSRISRHTKFEHLKTIIISEKLARQEAMIEHLIDFYIRDHEMRRNVHVIISKGDAKDILSYSPKLGDIPAISIQRIGDNYRKVLPMQKPKKIGEIAQNVVENRSFLIPRIVKHGNGLKIAGAAIIRRNPNKMIGWMGEQDVAGYNLIHGKVIDDVIETHYKEKPIVFETQDMSSVISYYKDENKNYFHVNIKAEGTLGESWIHEIDLNEEQTVENISNAIAQRIEESSSKIIARMQEEFHVDVFEFGSLIKRQDYPYWQKIRKQWDGKDGEFSKAEIKVTAEVQVRHYMLNEKLEEE